MTDETRKNLHHLASLASLRELQREKVWSRIHLAPLLLAEDDRDVYRRQQAALAREKEIMKDVEGWEVSRRYFCGSEKGYRGFPDCRGFLLGGGD